jgi:formylglycine-generating enzyme required for sulfatase activity
MFLKTMRIYLLLPSCIWMIWSPVLGAPNMPIQEPLDSMKSEQRIALVIGNDTYETAPLRNPGNDARTMARTLRELGFQVTEKLNLNQKEMKQEIYHFGQRLLKGGVGLFYYAGHGMQVNGRNFLVPIGARVEHERQIEFEGVDAASVLAEMEYARNRLNIVILDACRDNPFTRSFRSGTQGLASINAPTGTLIAYATAPGAVANDGPADHGVYTGELIKVMKTPGLKIEDVFKQVRSSVREATMGKQIPWESSSLEGDFYFKLPERAVASAPSSQVPAQVVAASAPRGEPPRQPFKTWKEPVTGIEFVWVPAGCFLMGSPQKEEGRGQDEGPVHEVCVDGFWMGRHEVTNGQFRKFQRDHDSRSYEGLSLNGDEQPVVHVTWEDAKCFAQWLSEKNGGQYLFRLPTEAEWEYAARAGTKGARYWGDEEGSACDYENIADLTAKKLWHWEDVHNCEDSYAATAPVGSYKPNAFGLHDMLGNVWEWCEDYYSVDFYANYDRQNPLNENARRGPDRVRRGGYWHGGPDSTRSASRSSGLPSTGSNDVGFRLVREPLKPAE